MKKSQKSPVPDFDVFPSYRGGHTCLYGGYVYEFAPDHHLSNRWGWVAQHRMIGEDILGRPLCQSKDPKRRECVHHIDEDRTNNAIKNLQIMTFSTHRALHTKLMNERKAKKISRQSAIEALEGRTIKQAASVLGVHHMTLRNRFSDLVTPRKRASPTRPTDKAAWKLVKPYATSDKFSMSETEKILHIGTGTLAKMCHVNKTKWVPKSKKGGIHRTYRGKPTQRWLKLRDSEIESGLLNQKIYDKQA